MIELAGDANAEGEDMFGWSRVTQFAAGSVSYVESQTPTTTSPARPRRPLPRPLSKRAAWIDKGRCDLVTV